MSPFMVAICRSTPPPFSVPLTTLPPAIEGMLGLRGAFGARGARVFEAEFAVARPDRNLGVKRTGDVVKFTHDWKGVMSSTSQVGADNAGRNRGVERFGFPEARDGYA